MVREPVFRSGVEDALKRMTPAKTEVAAGRKLNKLVCWFTTSTHSSQFRDEEIILGSHLTIMLPFSTCSNSPGLGASYVYASVRLSGLVVWSSYCDLLLSVHCSSSERVNKFETARVMHFM